MMYVFEIPKEIITQGVENYFIVDQYMFNPYLDLDGKWYFVAYPDIEYVYLRILFENKFTVNKVVLVRCKTHPFDRGIYDNALF